MIWVRVVRSARSFVFASTQGDGFGLQMILMEDKIPSTFLLWVFQLKQNTRNIMLIWKEKISLPLSEIWEWNMPKGGYPSPNLKHALTLETTVSEHLLLLQGFWTRTISVHKMCSWLRNILRNLFSTRIFLSNKIYVPAYSLCFGPVVLRSI